MLDAWLGDPETLTFYQWLDEWVAIAPSLTITWLALNLPFLLGFELVKASESEPNAVHFESRLQEVDAFKPDYDQREQNLTENISSAPLKDTNFQTKQSLDASVSSDSAAVEQMTPQTAAARGNEQTCPNTGFWNLIPEELGSNILLVQSELHYLSVTTDLGKTLILHSLKNALPYLEELDGIQTHRSVWVARCAIKSIKKVGRQGRADLLNGESVPVSRNRVSTVMDWFLQSRA
jgi:hypothetical protein